MYRTFARGDIAWEGCHHCHLDISIIPFPVWGKKDVKTAKAVAPYWHSLAVPSAFYGSVFSIFAYGGWETGGPYDYICMIISCLIRYGLGILLGWLGLNITHWSIFLKIWKYWREKNVFREFTPNKLLIKSCYQIHHLKLRLFEWAN